MSTGFNPSERNEFLQATNDLISKYSAEATLSSEKNSNRKASVQTETVTAIFKQVLFALNENVTQASNSTLSDRMNEKKVLDEMEEKVNSLSNLVKNTEKQDPELAKVSQEVKQKIFIRKLFLENCLQNNQEIKKGNPTVKINENQLTKNPENDNKIKKTSKNVISYLREQTNLIKNKFNTAIQKTIKNQPMQGKKRESEFIPEETKRIKEKIKQYEAEIAKLNGPVTKQTEVSVTFQSDHKKGIELLKQSIEDKDMDMQNAIVSELMKSLDSPKEFIGRFLPQNSLLTLVQTLEKMDHSEQKTQLMQKLRSVLSNEKNIPDMQLGSRTINYGEAFLHICKQTTDLAQFETKDMASRAVISLPDNLELSGTGHTFLTSHLQALALTQKQLNSLAQ